MKRVAIAGAAGRMGVTLIMALARQQQMQLCLALVEKQCPSLGKDSGTAAGCDANGVPYVQEIDSAEFDVLIDFSEAQAVTEHARYCAARKCAYVVGVTGMNAEGMQILAKAAKDIPIVHASNMSVGANVLASLAGHVAKLMPQSEVEIVEMHHRDKKDAPSGTANHLAEMVAVARGQVVPDCLITDRSNQKIARSAEEIGMSAMRGGDNVGEHTVMFIADGERLEISHRASDRMIFARGALRAALWATQQKAGLYDMSSVLGV